ncbi:MAG: glycosyltransferase [Deltaproteobacteria bacterium]|nr:glycosyltransferase [Deltaproteobacteria bacterium]
MSIKVAIVIPAYREALYIEKTLRSIEKSVQFANQSVPTPPVVIVVNNPATISRKFLKENQMLVRFLEDSKPLYSFEIHILDYTDPGIKFGVGQARKIGLEYAMVKWLHDPQDRLVCLDADTTVNAQYIAALYQNLDDISGFTIDCHHPTDREEMIFYELFLRYVPYGLQQAKSPFGFIAIGSAMGCTVEAYKKIGGMPAKSATEDFHFLNKLRKLAPIRVLSDAKVYPSDRKSFRVTLGTGAFLKSTGKNLEYAMQKLVIPTPEEYKRLQKVIESLQDFYATDSLLHLFEQINDVTSYQHLRERGIVEKLHKIKDGCTDMVTYFKRIMEIFDGLETIRLLRYYMQDRQPLTLGQFLTWCQQLHDPTAHIHSTDPLQMLHAYRQK